MTAIRVESSSSSCSKARIEALQMLTDNGTITKENIKTPHDVLDAKEHLWAHRDELLSDIRQQPNEGIHALSQHICNHITKCKFLHIQTQEILKIMLLQHAVCFHDARDWIVNRTSLHSPTSPCSPTAKYWN